MNLCFKYLHKLTHWEDVTLINMTLFIVFIITYFTLFVNKRKRQIDLFIGTLHVLLQLQLLQLCVLQYT